MTDPLNVILAVDELGRGALNINGLELGRYVKSLKLEADVSDLTKLTVTLVKVRVHAEAEVDTSEAKPSWEPEDPILTGPAVEAAAAQADRPEPGPPYCDHPKCYAKPHEGEEDSPHLDLWGDPLTAEELAATDEPDEPADEQAKDQGMKPVDIPF